VSKWEIILSIRGVFQKQKVFNKFVSTIYMNLRHATYYKPLEAVKEYLHPGGVKYFLLDAEPRLKEKYLGETVKHKPLMIMALISVMYLQASRVSEVPDMRMSHLRVFKESNIWYLRTKSGNVKNKKRKFKITTVSYSTPHDATFIKYVTRWFKYLYNYYNFEAQTGYSWKEALLDKYKTKEDKIKVHNLLHQKYLFSHNFEQNRKICNSAIQKQIISVLDCNAHFLRKLRGSILVDKFNASPRQIQEYLGHSDTVSAAPYLALSQKNLKNLVSNKQFV